MVRKRDHYTRQRSKRTRPKTPAPTNGWLLDELAQLTQTSRRRVRYYLEQRLIEPLERRGTATRYDRRALLRVLGILRLRAERGTNLQHIRRTLEQLGDRGLEDWLRTQRLPPSAATALGLTDTVHADQTNERDSDNRCTALKIANTWQRVCLLPGLELMVAADASAAVLRAARQIYDEYVGAAEARAPSLQTPAS